MEPIERTFTGFSARKLEQFLSRISDCVGRLTEDQVWMRGQENENAVGNLLLHLAGNVRQWIVSGVGGAPDVRERDAEFHARQGNTGEMLARLQETVREANAIIRGLDAEGLQRRVKIQKYDLPVLEAVYHVVEHFAQHTGQIIFATKLLTGADLSYYAHLRTAARAEKTP